MSKPNENNVVQQVLSEINKSKRESLKKNLRQKIVDYEKAKEAAQVIFDDIVQTIEDSGESVENLSEILG